MFNALKKKIYVSLIISIILTLLLFSTVSFILHMNLIYRDYVSKVLHNSEQFMTSIEMNLNLIEESTNFFMNKYKLDVLLSKDRYDYTLNRYMSNLQNSNLYINGSLIYSLKGQPYFSSGEYVTREFINFISKYISENYDKINVFKKHWCYIPYFQNSTSQNNGVLLYIYPILYNNEVLGYIIVDTSTTALQDAMHSQKNIFHNQYLTYLKLDNNYFIFNNTLPYKADFDKFNMASHGNIINKSLVSIHKQSDSYTVYDVVYMKYIYEQLCLVLIVVLVIITAVFAVIAFATKPFVIKILSPLDSLYKRMFEYSDNQLKGRNS